MTLVDSVTGSHSVVSHDEWLAARTRFLAREKEFTRLRDELSRERRDLPWERIEKPYVFDTPSGRETLVQLFGERSQLVVYHFMFGPDWAEGCPSCSFWADSFNGVDSHLRQRDVSFVAISRAPVAQIEAFRQRMGWSFKWVSSGSTDFNFDFGVSFTPEQVKSGAGFYNYGNQKVGAEMPGFSAFCRDARGTVFHTYSAYGRGIDLLNTAYNILDLAPKGRDEAGLKSPGAWIRHHDRYQA
jgi:predicted dithiol-disulfide oxidoreductase (DUF899 family)